MKNNTDDTFQSVEEDFKWEDVDKDAITSKQLFDKETSDKLEALMLLQKGI